MKSILLSLTPTIRFRAPRREALEEFPLELKPQTCFSVFYRIFSSASMLKGRAARTSPRSCLLYNELSATSLSGFSLMLKSPAMQKSWAPRTALSPSHVEHSTLYLRVYQHRFKIVASAETPEIICARNGRHAKYWQRGNIPNTCVCGGILVRKRCFTSH